MASADISSDLTGFSLGEKKAIKEAMASHWEPAKASMLKEFKLPISIDMPSVQAKSKDTARREGVPKVFTEIVNEYVKELLEFSKDASFKEALVKSVKSIKFIYECFDDNKPRASYSLVNGELQVLLNMSWLGYSVDAGKLSEYLQNNLGTSDETKTGGDLSDDLTGFNIGEKKKIKDAAAANLPAAVKLLSAYGLKITVNWPAFEKFTKGTARRDYVTKWVYESLVKEYSEELDKFAKSNADYKEAMMEAAKELLISCDCFDDNKPRANFSLANKVLTVNQNGSWISYSVNPDEVSKFLEKSL